MIQENLKGIRSRIDAAAVRAGRQPEDVTLVAVSKTKPIEVLKEAYDAGIRLFGENKVQEIREKFESFGDDTQFHMIGHLQTNKVKYIVDKVTCIHSVDSLKLAMKIQSEAEKKSVDEVGVLIEVNMAGEESKFGVLPRDLETLLKEMSVLDRVKVRGLMTVAPYVENPELNRPVFKALRELSVDMANKKLDNITMTELSMGMTGDFEVAIEEGATMVRIGTALFGERDYSKE